MDQYLGSEPQLLDMNQPVAQFSCQNHPKSFHSNHNILHKAERNHTAGAHILQPLTFNILPGSNSLKPNQLPKTISQANSVDSINKISQDQQQICLAHNKILQIICTNDQALICSSCAIFCHKGHEFKSLKQFEEDKLAHCHQLVDLTEGKKCLQRNICGDKAIIGLKEQFEAVRIRLRQEIKDKFKTIIQTARQSQLRCLEKINKALIQQEQSIKNLLTLSQQKMQSYQDWESIAYEQLKIFEDSRDMVQQMRILNYGNKKASQTSFLAQGEKIIQELRKYQANINSKINESLSLFVFEFDPEIQIRLSNLPEVLFKKDKRFSTDVTFSEASNNSQLQIMSDLSSTQSVLFHKQNHDNFRQSHRHTASSGLLSMVRTNRQSSSTFDINEFPQGSPLASTLKLQTLSTNKLPILSPRNFQSPNKNLGSLTPDQRIRKVMVRLKLSDKYSKIVGVAICESSQIFDLTNCGLDEGTIVSLVQVSKSNKSIKHLKLNRNRFTDQNFEKIIPHITNIAILNLSQNYLGDKSMQILLNCAQILPNLRTVILSQNRIREKAFKQKIQELRKLNVSIVI